MSEKIKFIFNASELGAGTRGSGLGPSSVQVAAWNKKSPLFEHYAVRKVKDQNELLSLSSPYQYAKHINGILEVHFEVSAEVKATLSQGIFPFMLSGDHSSAAATVAGIKMKYPQERIGVVWIDAHSDLHSPYTTPSGNLHGMPVAVILGEDNMHCKINTIEEKVEQLWEELKQVGGITPKVKAEDFIFVAVRDTEEQEDEVRERLGIPNITVEEVNAKGVEAAAQKILAQLNNCDKIYVSFDVDSMDPIVVSHGTGTPVDNGMMPSQAYELVKYLISSGKVCCLEVVEINPCLDEKKNKMAETALDLIQKWVLDIEGQLQ